jgi:hypothetical protein
MGDPRRVRDLVTGEAFTVVQPALDGMADEPDAGALLLPMDWEE